MPTQNSQLLRLTEGEEGKGKREKGREERGWERDRDRERELIHPEKTQEETFPPKEIFWESLLWLRGLRS